MTDEPPLPKLTTGGEDWLSVNFYIDHNAFPKLCQRLDEAQTAAVAGKTGRDEVCFGGFTFIVADRGVRQGSGPKAAIMRWRMQSEHGLTVLLMNREKSHATLANAQVRATSLALMRYGFDRVWQLMQDYLRALDASIRANKLSRVDPCVDLCDFPLDRLAVPFNSRWLITRSRNRSRYGEGLVLNEFIAAETTTGFYVGKSPVLVRTYDKLQEARRDPVKHAILVAQRWGRVPVEATRVEYQLQRGKLKHLGVDTVEDWIQKRGDVMAHLTTDWFRLTAGPVDRKHPERSETHPAWKEVAAAFAAWTGELSGAELTPLPKLWVDTSKLTAMAVGIFKGCFARVGKPIEDNEQFYREVMFAVRQCVGDRDMSQEVWRRAIELGATVVPARDSYEENL